ncbi:MAG: T9SS outer membrane translocon Sov/SprA, partial [Candidatus Krumholzibacteriia bacterium]
MSARAGLPRRPARPPRRAWRGGPSSWPGALVAVVLLLLGAGPLRAGPAGDELILPGFDPLLAATRDPRLLGVARLEVRARLLAQGVDPARLVEHPTLASVVRAYYDREWRRDRDRLETTREADGAEDIETTFTYPRWFLLFPAAEPLPDGFTWWPPRPVDAPEVRVRIERPAVAAERRARVEEREVWAALLDTRSGKGGRAGREGLLNLTIPIKLPHTLEKIIGKGEKTNIKVSGREHIAISGESTIIKPFVGNERRSKPSLFPNLDMEQQLQINLSGTIGEKIIIEVDHNSEVIGPGGTKIKLSYRGTEDEVIKTIETGDVGLTLPGSQLLGYSSNKSGLFGIKVTGQMGRVDFTAVASKQKSESASKSFNSKGGEVTEHVIECQNYVANRFFYLDLQAGTTAFDGVVDVPGRAAGLKIDPQSVHVYQFVANAAPSASSIENVALYLDTSGIWNLDAAPAPFPGQRFTEVEWLPLNDENNQMIAIDLTRSYEDGAMLGVIYSVVDAAGAVQYKVGDVPGLDEAHRVPLGTDGKLYLHMKLLKPDFYTQQNAHTWYYAMRNIYPLGGTNIDASSFQFEIQFNSTALEAPGYDSGNVSLPWIRIFGLDRLDTAGNPVPDGVADYQDGLLFDLVNGLLKFPRNVTRPFAMADSSVYITNAGGATAFNWQTSQLRTNEVPEIYDYTVPAAQRGQYNRFKLVARHAAASGTIDLRDSNIEEGSETVVLDGQTLTKGTDYDIDYTFGQVTLKGDAAARLSADSQISVNYQYAPFMGGGNSNLLGFNLGFDLGGESHLSTTLLYESSQIAGHKAKLGEEPSRTLVGNLNLTHTVRPAFLTSVANFLSRRDSDRESSLQLSGEIAGSVPNPNTQGDVYLEDFEGIDASDIMPVSRLSWMWGSAPAQGRDADYVNAVNDPRDFTPQDRAQVRWFLPKDVVQRRFLNPDLREAEGKEPQQVLQLWMDAGDAGWGNSTWGGIMRGLGRSGIDLSKAQFLEFWVNDFRPQPTERRGKLHIDFGYIDEDFYWPVRDGALVLGTWEREDINPPDGIFTAATEDVGLDRELNGPGAPDYYAPDFNSYADPYPQINGTERNLREDSEDLDGDTLLDRLNGYYSITVDLADSAQVDVLRDYAPDQVTGLEAAGQAWRKFRVRLNDARPVSPPDGTAPQIRQVTHVRVWYEDGSAGAPRQTQLQLSEIKFLGSRWEREGIRKIVSEQLLPLEERGGGEAFFLGEVNNKENPDYYSPFNVHEENRIPEKETSLVLDFAELERDHLARASRYVSPRGDDYTQYSEISWYWFNPRADQSDIDLFYRVGSDSLNYYEVRWRFDESSDSRTGWKEFVLGLGELSNAKLDPLDVEHGWIETTVPDKVTGQPYRVRVVGKPDLRRVKRFYFGVANEQRDLPVSGYFYFNDVRLQSVKREKGLAERVAARLNMADVIKVDFDWSKRDADFHGLGTTVGQGFQNQDWSLTTSLRADDFVPLLGFQVPINLSRRQAISRPKYMTNNDIELLGEAIRNAQSTIDTRESYSVSLNHEPSRAALLRYLVDPWRFSVSGARSSRLGPTDRLWQSNSQGSVTYDLRILGNYRVGNYLFLDAVPLLGDLVVVPRKITLGGSVGSSRQANESIALDGVVTTRPLQYSRRGSLNAALEYSPLPLAEISVNLKSDRDFLRPRDGAFGLNVGREMLYTQGIQVRFNPPKATQLPDTWLLAPLRYGAKALNSMRPNVTFNGQFTANRDPSQRQAGDPENVRSVSNGGDWDFRLSLPIDKFIKDRFPDRRPVTGVERRETIERARRFGKRPGGGPDSGALPDGGETAPAPAAPPGGAAADSAGAPGAAASQPEAGVPASPEEEELLTPEQRQAREEEALLAEAREMEERERAARPGGAPPDTSPAAARPR